MEDGAEFFVEGDGFDIPAGDPADVGVLVEVDGAGRFGGDESVLGAGFGVDEDLGFLRDIEQLQEFEEVFAAGGFVEEGFSVLDAVGYFGDGGGGDGFGVANGVAFVCGVRGESADGEGEAESDESGSH